MYFNSLIERHLISSCSASRSVCLWCHRNLWLVFHRTVAPPLECWCSFHRHLPVSLYLGVQTKVWHLFIPAVQHCGAWCAGIKWGIICALKFQGTGGARRESCWWEYVRSFWRRLTEMGGGKWMWGLVSVMCLCSTKRAGPSTCVVLWPFPFPWCPSWSGLLCLALL